MPQAVVEPLNLISTTTPVVAAQSDDQESLEYDHLWLRVDFTIGSLTDCVVSLQFGHWSSGPTWKDVVDANQGAVEQTFTSSFDSWIIFSTQHNNTRMSPAPLAAPMWRVDINPSGTNTSSSIEVDGSPFSVGSIRE